MSDVHIGFKYHVYPGEMHLLLKALSHGQAYLEATHQLSDDEMQVLDAALDSFKDQVLSF